MEWVEITEFPGYWVNKKGEVYSERSKKILKPKSDGNGYFQYALRKEGKTFYRKRYRLVAKYFTHFVPMKDVNYDIHHVDETTTNDYIENLMIVDHRYNICVAKADPIIVTHLTTGEKYTHAEGFNHWCRTMGWKSKDASSKFSRDGKYKGYTYVKSGEKYGS